MGGIVLNSVEKNNFNLEIEKEIRDVFKEKVYINSIPKNIKILESQKEGKPLVETSANGVAAASFLNLAREVINNEKN